MLVHLLAPQDVVFLVPLHVLPGRPRHRAFTVFLCRQGYAALQRPWVSSVWLCSTLTSVFRPGVPSGHGLAGNPVTIVPSATPIIIQIPPLIDSSTGVNRAADDLRDALDPGTAKDLHRRIGPSIAHLEAIDNSLTAILSIA